MEGFDLKLKLINLISGYERVDGLDTPMANRSSKRFFKRKLSGSISSHAEGSSAGRLVRFSYNVFNIASYTSSRAYGAFLLAFAILTMLLNSGANFLFVDLPSDTASLVIGAAAAVISIPFFFLEGPLAPALERHKLTEELFFEFFSIKRPSKSAEAHGIPLIVCLAAGILFAVLGFFISVYTVLFIIVGVLFAYLAFVSPEFSLFSCILILPSVSAFPIHDYIASFVAFIMFLSYIRKAAFGKRSYNFEQYDILICLMMLFIILSGIFVGGASSFQLGVVIFTSTFVYFATGNLITNPRLVDCMVKSLVLSSVVPCVTGTVQFIIQAFDLGLAAALKTGVSATFTSPGAFAAFLIVPTCFSFMFAREKHSAAYAVIFVFNCLLLIMSGNFVAPIALVIAVASYALMRSHRLGFIPMLLLIALPYIAAFLATVLPISDALSLIISGSFEDMLAVFGVSLDMLKESPLFGVGISPEVFSEAISGALHIGVTDSGNLFLDIAVKSGAVTVILFILLLLVRLRHRIFYRRFLEESSVGSLSATASITVIALVVFGSFNAVFAEISLYYIFFSVFAIGSATLRIACDEHDDRVAYFRDARRTYSAAVDLDLR